MNIIMTIFINQGKNTFVMTIKTKDGRIYLSKEIREKYGERFRMIECKDRIVLLPVSEDPLKKLREEWEDVEGTVEELKEKALKEAIDEAGG